MFLRQYHIILEDLREGNFDLIDLDWLQYYIYSYLS